MTDLVTNSPAWPVRDIDVLTHSVLGSEGFRSPAYPRTTGLVARGRSPAQGSWMENGPSSTAWGALGEEIEVSGPAPAALNAKLAPGVLSELS